MGKLSVITNRIKRCAGLGASLVLAFVMLNAAPVFADTDALAVDPVKSNDGYSAVVYDNTNGMPVSEANDIAQTSDGFIWIGSYGGLVRYDGNTFERLDSTQGIDSIACLLVDSSDRLWVGTNDNGIALMENGEFRFWGLNDGLQSLKITDIAEDAAGNIYIGTTTGIVMMTPEMEIIPLKDKRIAKAYIENMSADEDGLIYGITHDEGMFMLRDGNLVNYYENSELNVGTIISVFPDPDTPGWIYYGTEDQGIFHVNPKDSFDTAEHISIDPLLSVNSMKKIGDKIWVCTRSGIGAIDKNGFHRLDYLPLNNSVDHVMGDYEGNLWFTSTRQGIMKLVPNRFSDVFARYNIPQTVVNTTCMYDGKLFVGTDTEGLIVIGDDGPLDSLPLNSVRMASGGAFSAAESADLIKLLKGVRIRSVIRDRSGNLWISTWRSYGLLRYKDGELTVFDTSEGLLSDRIRAVFETRDGSILVALTGGLNTIKGDRVTQSFSQKDGIVNSESLCACEAPNGDMLLGSNGDGIYVIHKDKKTVSNINRMNGFTSDVIMRIKYDAENEVFWIVTGNSLAYMTKDYQVRTIKNFPYPDNLDIVKNRDGYLWILSSDGIYVCSPEELMSGKASEPVHYGMKNGLPCITTNNAYSCLTNKGTLYIAGRTGVAAVNIDDPIEDGHDLKQIVPFVDADGKRIYPDKKGVFHIPGITHKLTVYGFVCSNSLVDPVVSYYLKGFDRRATTVKRSDFDPVIYTNLSGGSYSFVMELQDMMGSGSKISTVRIIKERAFYEQPWFFVLALAAFAASSLGVIQLFVRRKLKELEAKHRAEAEKQRVNDELTMASRIQYSILPHDFPPFPERGEFDIYATMDPAREVGGDFYDFFMIDDDHLCLVIADVSGKGIPASLFMMNAKVIIKSYAKGENTPAEVLEKTNDEVCSNNLLDLFVTVWIGILEISTGRLTTANAGHEYPAVRRRGGNFELIKRKHGIVVGGMDGLKYTDYEFQLEPGDKLFVYTDGVPEATNSKNEMFGTDRMLAALNADKDASPEQLLKGVRKAVSDFTAGAEPFDDLTMLGLEYNGTERS